jgi:integrase
MDSIPTNTASSATPAKRSGFVKTSIPGLYRRGEGQYYSRYSLNGKRTWRCLQTEVYSIAKLRHAKRTGVIEEARQQGATINPDLQCLGALSRALMSEVNSSNAQPSTKRQYQVWVDRLRTHWDGDFETAQARLVTRDTITGIRKYLLSSAPRPQQPTRLGYKPAVVNQTLTVLRLMLNIAERHNVILKNPFNDEGAIRQSIYLPNDSRRPDIPSNENMERIFADMARVYDPERFDETTLKYYQTCAENAAEHARFLAYSGLRLEEANTLTWDDVKADFITVRGTKTETSDRLVPIIPPLRALLAQLRTKRIAGRILGCKASIDTLQRSCKRLGLPMLRHHDLRHYFATVCIESGVPIPTVADWLGHADGGTLLLKTYRHLRNGHSLDAAKLVTLPVPHAQSTPASPAAAAC